MLAGALAAALCTLPARAQQGASTPVYRCPGPPVLYTDAITPQEARERGCRTIEGTPITIMQSPKPKPKAGEAASGARAGGAAASGGDSKVDSQAQRQRESDRRKILEAELRKEEDKLAALNKDYNGGNPERRGDEQNYAKYQDRVAEMKAAIARKEGDIAAIKRELANLPQ
jgi:hypothetical protein